MPEFWFYLIPKPYKNIFFFQICFRLLKVEEDMAFDNDEVYLECSCAPWKQWWLRNAPPLCPKKQLTTTKDNPAFPYSQIRPASILSQESHRICRWLPCSLASIKPRLPSFSLRHSSLTNVLPIAKLYPWLTGAYCLSHFIKRGLVLRGFIFSLKDSIRWKINSWQ